MESLKEHEDGHQETHRHRERWRERHNMPKSQELINLYNTALPKEAKDDNEQKHKRNEDHLAPEK